MREEREYRETLRGKYEINWKGIHERAIMLTKVKQRSHKARNLFTRLQKLKSIVFLMSLELIKREAWKMQRKMHM